MPLCYGKSRWSEDGRGKGQAKAEAIKLMNFMYLHQCMHQARQSCAAAGTAISTCTSGKGTPASGKGNKTRADSTSQLSSKVLAVFHSLHHLGRHHQGPPRSRALSVPPSRDGKVISSPTSAAFLTQGKSFIHDASSGGRQGRHNGFVETSVPRYFLPTRACDQFNCTSCDSVAVLRSVL